MAKPKKSVFDKALGGSRRRRRRGSWGGMADMMDGPRRGRKRKKSMLSEMTTAFDKRLSPTKKALGFGRRRRRGGMIAQVASSLRERWTPTQRAQYQQDADRAIDDDNYLSGRQQDEGLTQNETFIRRLVRLVGERLRRP